MKKIIIIICFIICSIAAFSQSRASCSVSATILKPIPNKTVIPNTVLKSSPDSNSAALTVLEEGSKIDIIDFSPPFQFASIIYQGVLGYCQPTAINDSILSILRQQNKKKNITTENLEVGISSKSVVNILGHPNEVIKLINDKEKWCYEKLYIYFKNDLVDVIQAH